MNELIKKYEKETGNIFYTVRIDSGENLYTPEFVEWLIEQLKLSVVSNNEVIDVDLDFVVKFPIKKTTTYKLKKKDSGVMVCPQCNGTGRDGHDRCYPPNWYVCDICNGSG